MKACPFCRESIHDDAIKCRFCNEMLSQGTVRPAVPAQPPVKPKRGLLASMALLVIGAIVVYSVLPRGAKDTVNAVASRSGVAGRVVPWAERADTALRQMLDGENGPIAARSIQALAHPAGTNPSLNGYEVRQLGDRVSARISVSWQGSLTGIVYTTEVIWEFSESGHGSATISFDNGPVGVFQADRARVDDWFRTSFFPVLYGNVGG